MPITVNELVEKVGLDPKSLKKVKWGTLVSSRNEGVYIVAMSKPLKKIPINKDKVKFDNWKIDTIPTNDFSRIKKRLSKFWLSDETILYIGESSNIKSRIKQYYKTVNKNSENHKGGFWLKYIDIPNDTFIYYIECANSNAYEAEMLCAFFEQVSTENRKRLFGTGIVLPFANREIKVIHGLTSKNRPA